MSDAKDIKRAHQAHIEAHHCDLFPMWTVYSHPRDYPHGWVARMHAVGLSGEVVRGPAVYGLTLERVRAKLPPGLRRLSRDVNDEPHIVETWF
jgi:hypothetical protein